jgi:hypothetical protein
MLRNEYAILLGLVTSIVLTPVVVGLWQRHYPPRQSQGSMLTTEGWRRSNAIYAESIVAMVAAVLLLGLGLGFSRRMNIALSCVLIGCIVATPAMWAMLRTSVIGPQARSEFLAYIEEKYRVSSASWLAVSGLGVLLAAYGFVRDVSY